LATGYRLAEADSLDAAVALAESTQILATSGSVEEAETIDR